MKSLSNDEQICFKLNNSSTSNFDCTYIGKLLLNLDLFERRKIIGSPLNNLKYLKIGFIMND
jgi:hypothetical protein